MTAIASKGPSCGHSACSQNYIDTGETSCVTETCIAVTRLRHGTPGGARYRIRGELVPASDQADVSLPASAPAPCAWWDVPLPPCPDCGGELVWFEAGYVPGTRRCMGPPVGGTDDAPSYELDGGCGSMFSVDTI